MTKFVFSVASRGIEEGGGFAVLTEKELERKIPRRLEHPESEDNQKVFPSDRAAFQARYRSI